MHIHSSCPKFVNTDLKRDHEKLSDVVYIHGVFMVQVYFELRP